MTFTACYSLSQLCICALGSLDPLFAQQCCPFYNPQTFDSIVLQIRGRVFTRALRPGAAGQQDATRTLLAVDDVEPFADTWAVWKGVPGLPIQQVLKLIENNEPGFINRIQHIEE